MKGRGSSSLWPASVRWAFWLLYNPLSWTYDCVSWGVSLGQWRRWQRAVLPKLCGHRVLELASGTGNLQLDLHAQGHDPVGMDLSPWMIDRARHKLTSRGVPSKLVRGRAQQLPFEVGAFDAVVCTFPTSFMQEPSVMHEVARVLRPSGWLVVVVMAQLLGSDPLRRLVEWLYRITYQRGSLPDVRPILASAGLYGQVERVLANGSVVWLIVAQKS